VIYIEFVPVTREARHLAPGDGSGSSPSAMAELRMASRCDPAGLPRDERPTAAACRRAGLLPTQFPTVARSPAPFSPYSDINVRDPPCGWPATRLFLRADGVF
jgi:hypothetical protein